MEVEVPELVRHLREDVVRIGRQLEGHRVADGGLPIEVLNLRSGRELTIRKDLRELVRVAQRQAVLGSRQTGSGDRNARVLIERRGRIARVTAEVSAVDLESVELGRLGRALEEAAILVDAQDRVLRIALVIGAHPLPERQLGRRVVVEQAGDREEVDLGGVHPGAVPLVPIPRDAVGAVTRPGYAVATRAISSVVRQVRAPELAGVRQSAVPRVRIQRQVPRRLVRAASHAGGAVADLNVVAGSWKDAEHEVHADVGTRAARQYGIPRDVLTAARAAQAPRAA